MAHRTVTFPNGSKVVVPHVGLAADSTLELLAVREVKPCKEGWGDKLEAELTAMGITEDSYKAVKKKFGMPPTCWCPQRKEWLNKVGRWFDSLRAPKG